ncbi:MAG: VWA domain-containing protein, partial [Planctomycetales bacterium]|nr:VWA domain-containing protein [Planctomycetales bacterium]
RWGLGPSSPAAAGQNAAGPTCGEADAAAAHESSLMCLAVSALSSISLHTALLIACALISFGGRETHSEPGEQVSIATLTTASLTDHREQLDADALAQSAGDASLDDSLALDIASPGAAASDPALVDAIAALAPSGGRGAAIDAAMGAVPAGGALDGQATFMGVQARGRRFCIIADRSGSMLGDKFDYLRREIMHTVDGMGRQTRVQVVLFNTRALPYPTPLWLHPKDDRAEIQVWLDSVVADGDTNPTPAFVHAFSLEPLPDAIFFMTDGQFDPRVVVQIRRLNAVAQHKTPIHTITFVDRVAEGMMRLIAEESGGEYRHVKEVK